MGARSGGGAGGGMGSRSRATEAHRAKIIGILKENRDSVINQIRWSYLEELKSGEKTLKGVMEEAVEKAVKEPQWTANAKIIKTTLRNMIKKMHYVYAKPKMEAKKAAEEAANLKKYGTKRPKLADIMAHYEEVTGVNTYAEWHKHKFGVNPR